MKRYIALILELFIFFSLSAYDFKELTFSTKPKTVFSTQQNISNELKTGLAQGKEEATQNKRDLALPDKKLLRGFERLPKTDAFGDIIPDSFLFYRETLNANQKSAYDEIYKAIMNAESNLKIITRVSNREIFQIIHCVYLDNPELFWWAEDCSWWYNSDGTVTNLVFNYLFDQDELRRCNQEFLNMSLPVIFYANLLETDMEKIKYVHDYLCLSIDYDTDAFNANSYGGKLQTAYSAIVEYKTVCAGYSRAFAYYMQQLRIPCTVLYSSTHAWNMIEIEGEVYQTDVTWDDGKNKIPQFFNISNKRMQTVEHHMPEEISMRVVQQHPSSSDYYSYSKYFGQIPIGFPYTYQEFNNIEDDIDNPAFAQVILAE